MCCFVLFNCVNAITTMLSFLPKKKRTPRNLQRKAEKEKNDEQETVNIKKHDYKELLFYELFDATFKPASIIASESFCIITNNKVVYGLYKSNDFPTLRKFFNEKYYNTRIKRYGFGIHQENDEPFEIFHHQSISPLKIMKKVLTFIDYNEYNKCDVVSDNLNFEKWYINSDIRNGKTYKNQFVFFWLNGKIVSKATDKQHPKFTVDVPQALADDNRGSILFVYTGNLKCRSIKGSKQCPWNCICVSMYKILLCVCTWWLCQCFT